MNILIFLLFFSFSRALDESAPYYSLDKAHQYFEEFLHDYDIQYEDGAEKDKRFEIFKQNLEEVNRLNEESKNLAKSGPYVIYGITQFMDLTAEEFSNMYTTFNGSHTSYQAGCQALTDRDIPNVNAPDSFDWREKNAVTRVKNQGQCGSCYSFSSTGHLEAQNAIKHNQLVELSEQQIVDCDKRSHGCHTGFMTNAFMSIMELGGIMSESDYPYTAREGQCRYNRNAVLKINRCFSYSLRSQETLKRLLVSVGPISIGVQASGLRMYKGGVFPDQSCNQGSVNHAVLLVGYGTDARQGPYWIVKNSYGTTFGESGYFRMQRGERALSCGMMNEHMASASIA